MGTSSQRGGGTVEIVRARERVGLIVMAALAAWVLYAVGAGSLALAALELIESVAVRVLVAAAAVAALVFALTNARTLARLARPYARRLINYVTPVMPAEVTKERLVQVQKKLAAIDQRVTSAVALRESNEAEVARLRNERAGVVREATRARDGADDAQLARRLSRAQEALARREEQLELARADEGRLLDAREICDVCAQRLSAARERYLAGLAVAREVGGVRALVGAHTQADEESAQAAEDACWAEVAAVDQMMANLDSTLYERRLEERAAALELAELRAQARSVGAGVRVVPPPLPTDPVRMARGRVPQDPVSMARGVPTHVGAHEMPATDASPDAKRGRRAGR